MSSLLSDSDAQSIEAAVRKVESESSTELVVAVLGRSGDYALPRVLVSGAWSLAAAIALLHYTSWAPLWAVLAELPIAALVYAILGAAPLHRALITRTQAAACVQRRAFELFASRGVHRTVGRTGLLVVISELERHVVILGDSKIQELIGHEGFQEHVQKLIQRLKSGEGARGILELIEDFRPLLAQHAPRKTDDVNELPDAVIRA